MASVDAERVVALLVALRVPLSLRLAHLRIPCPSKSESGDVRHIPIKEGPRSRGRRRVPAREARGLILTARRGPVRSLLPWFSSDGGRAFRFPITPAGKRHERGKGR